jgi:hypothetical protein
VEDVAIGVVRRKEKVHASGGKPPSDIEGPEDRDELPPEWSSLAMVLKLVDSRYTRLRDQARHAQWSNGAR